MKLLKFTTWIIFFMTLTLPALLADEIFDGVESMVTEAVLLKRSHLKKLTKSEMKILIEAIHARHGKKFKNPQMNSFFRSREWYTAGNYSKNKLNMIDKANINTLKSVMRKAINSRDNEVKLSDIPFSPSISQEKKIINVEESTSITTNSTPLIEPIYSSTPSTTTISKGNTNRISIEKNIYIPGEKIIIHINDVSYLDYSSWIGIIASAIEHGSVSINDKNDLSYKYFRNAKNGRIIMYAPFVPDNYDLRINDKTKNPGEVGYLSFKVKGLVGKGPKLMLEKTTFRRNEEIALRFIADNSFDKSAWVGIVESKYDHGSESLNDSHDRGYKNLKLADNGVFYFRAPSSPGRYDFRLNDNDNNGKEVTYISFKVVR